MKENKKWIGIIILGILLIGLLFVGFLCVNNDIGVAANKKVGGHYEKYRNLSEM